jgi:hypothetical protein
LRGASNTIKNLTVNGFSGSKILISGTSSSNNLIQGCYIGTNATGTDNDVNSSSYGIPCSMRQ